MARKVRCCSAPQRIDPLAQLRLVASQNLLRVPSAPERELPCSTKAFGGAYMPTNRALTVSDHVDFNDGGCPKISAMDAREDLPCTNRRSSTTGI